MNRVATRKLNGGLLALVLVLLGLPASCGPGTSPEKQSANDISAPVAAALITSTVAANDDVTVSYRMSAEGSHQFFRVFVDTDQSPDTGFARAGIGADYLVENGRLYRYSGSGRDWAWGFVTIVDYTTANLTASWTIARADLGETNPCMEATDLVFDVDDTVAPILTHKYTTAGAACGGPPADAGAGQTIPPPDGGTPAGNHIDYVFVITMENESAAAIYGSPRAIHQQRATAPLRARQHLRRSAARRDVPSEPHYVWMEAGTNTFSDTTFTDRQRSVGDATAPPARRTSRRR